MLEDLILDLIIAIYSGFVGIIFGIICIKQRYLLSWLIPAAAYAIGANLLYFTPVDPIYGLIGISLYLLAILSLIIATFVEYYQMIVKKVSQTAPDSKFIGFIVILAMAASPIFQIQIILMISTSVAVIMLFHIYLRKRTPTRMFMFLTVLSSLISLITAFLSEYHLIGVWELSYVTNFTTISFFLVTALSSFLEVRLVRSETKYREAYNRAEFYKDLFLHDTNNIFQGILSAKDLLTFHKEDPVKFDIIEISKVIDEQVIRGARLISNIRKLSQLEQSSLSFTTLNLYELLSRSISFVEKSFQDKHMEIQLKTYDQTIFVQANELLSDVFENILINAIKHNRNPNIEILIEISKQQIKSENWIKLQFKDNGIGINDSRKEIIFQRTSDRSTRSGMGLGLSLVKKILDLISSKIWVEDRFTGDYSKGSNFIILIPGVE